jgi:hypothetical protein
MGIKFYGKGKLKLGITNPYKFTGCPKTKLEIRES